MQGNRAKFIPSLIRRGGEGGEGGGEDGGGRREGGGGLPKGVGGFTLLVNTLQASGTPSKNLLHHSLENLCLSQKSLSIRFKKM